MAIQQKHKAAKQGHLDGACGFYAIANAIHLLEPELKQQDIFSLAFKVFLEDGDPMRFVEGTNRGSIKNTLSRVIKNLYEEYLFTLDDGNPYSINFEIPYWLESKPRTRADVLEVLSTADHKQGNVALMGYTYNDGYQDNSHWTVIKQYKDGYLYTFDSSEEAKKIPLDGIRIDAKHDQHASRPYNIISGDIFRLWRQ
ncbi:hypothetical protein [Methylobacter sp.]|uniref:hypothetical protein n=1 Tax=Methylobacter sp. TaxID=2051955 RepID=UPI002FDF11A7